MRWLTPPVIKIYEALGAVADDRVELSEDSAKVYSSSGNKFYHVRYSSRENSITANDNGSYWKGYLGYPMIAYLFSIDRLTYDRSFAEALSRIAWKDLNTQLKNDFLLVEQRVREQMKVRGVDLSSFDKYKDKVMKEIEDSNLVKLGKTSQPPKGY